VATLALFGLYGDRAAAPASKVGRTVLAVTVVVLAAFPTLMFWTDVFVSRSWLALTSAIAVVLLLASRVVWRLAIGRPPP
jgi:uncharacterized membrane protein (DUF4010 family)